MSHDSNSADIGGMAAEALRQFIERVERLHEEKRALEQDIADVYRQAKSQGFEPKIMKKVVALRRMEDHEREETDQLMDLYCTALGMS